MSKDAQTKRGDSRPPVWQGMIKGKLVTIYDWAAYYESLRLYPDEPTVPSDGNPNARRVGQLANYKPAFAKQKPLARYNWIVKLDEPLKGRA